MKDIDNIGKTLGILIGIVFLLFFNGSELYQWFWFSLILVTIGIPHGAIDHLLDNPKIGKNDLRKFIVKYLLIIVVYYLVWYFFPKTALLLFIVMSAFHFGQSHFIKDEISQLKPITYFSLGAFYLSVIFWGDFETLTLILDSTINISGWQFVGSFVIFGLLLLNTLLLLIFQKDKKIKVWMEMLILGPVLYLVPLLLGFILYFGFWHALPSMLAEYKTLKHHLEGNKLRSFITRLIPFSLISLIGIAIVLIVFSSQLPQKDLIMLFFIMVALISAPHIWFMNKFLETKHL